jgi:hypothetical protein
MNGITEENARFESTMIVDTTEAKAEVLRNFFQNDCLGEVDGVPVNRNKFLYLYGEQNTGQLSILKKVAQEVFGDRWESKVYLRRDEGQRYPYKLHAHKVESSKRVVFITHSRLSWAKWKELYPGLQTFTFLGAEAQANNDGIVRVRYFQNFTENQQRKEQFARDIQAILTETCQTMNVPEDTLRLLKEKVMRRIREDWVEQHGIFIRSEVIESTV